MTGIWRVALVVLMFFAVTTTSAQAFGRSGMFSTPSRVSNYMVIPSTYYCWPTPTTTPLPRIIPVPNANPKYATPSAAPPSATTEPPFGDSRMPKIIAKSPDVAKDRCRVGFWNLAGRDLSVMIEGKSYALPKNQVLTFDMDRQFTWQVTGKTAQIQRVPEGQAAYEVLIRE
jgi:hypothetical protein